MDDEFVFVVAFVVVVALIVAIISPVIMKNIKTYAFDFDDNILHLSSTSRHYVEKTTAAVDLSSYEGLIYTNPSVKVYPPNETHTVAVELTTAVYAQLSPTPIFKQRFLPGKDTYEAFGDNRRFLFDLHDAILNLDKHIAPCFFKFIEAVETRSPLAIITARAQDSLIIRHGLKVLLVAYYANEEYFKHIAQKCNYMNEDAEQKGRLMGNTLDRNDRNKVDESNLHNSTRKCDGKCGDKCDDRCDSVEIVGLVDTREVCQMESDEQHFYSIGDIDFKALILDVSAVDYPGLSEDLIKYINYQFIYPVSNINFIHSYYFSKGKPHNVADAKAYCVQEFVEYLHHTIVKPSADDTQYRFAFGFSDDDPRNLKSVADFLQNKLAPAYPHIKFVLYDSSNPLQVSKLKIEN